MLECGTDTCPCVIKKCARYGKCEECIDHHKTHKKYPEPYCKRPRKEKKTKATANLTEEKQNCRNMYL